VDISEMIFHPKFNKVLSDLVQKGKINVDFTLSLTLIKMSQSPLL
jgi:hypothetical protein